jgi:Domain of unknown function (DUF2760)
VKRIILAFKAFFRVLLGRPLPAELLPAGGAVAAPALASPAPAAPAPAPASDGAVQLLALLQREGRLIDFLEEEITGYGDAQIGAAVRDIHRGCRKVLREYFAIEPVMAGAENAMVQVPSGFDAAAIRLVGNVVGQPPYRGALRHHGWRTTRVELPNAAPLAGPAIVAPAEVELS